MIVGLFDMVVGWLVRLITRWFMLCFRGLMVWCFGICWVCGWFVSCGLRVWVFRLFMVCLNWCIAGAFDCWVSWLVVVLVTYLCYILLWLFSLGCLFGSCLVWMSRAAFAFYDLDFVSLWWMWLFIVLVRLIVLVWLFL